MNQLELRVQQHPGTIELNFEELNAALDAKLAEYEGAIFTEDSKDIAKVEKEYFTIYPSFNASCSILLVRVEKKASFCAS